MDILTIPNPILYTKAEQVTGFDSALALLADEMRITAVQNNLVGLAANQVGILQRVFVLNFAATENAESTGEILSPNFVTFVNPRIEFIKNKGTAWNLEGCGSILGVRYLVERHNTIRITAQNIHGNEFGLMLEGYYARIAQHEYDHLNGITLNKKKFRKIVPYK